MRRVSNSNISGTRFSAGARVENHPHFRRGPLPKTCCRKFQTENVLFPAAQETEKFSKPKKGKKKFGIPAAQETVLRGNFPAKFPRPEFPQEILARILLAEEILKPKIFWRHEEILRGILGSLDNITEISALSQ